MAFPLNPTMILPQYSNLGEGVKNKNDNIRWSYQTILDNLVKVSKTPYIIFGKDQVCYNWTGQNKKKSLKQDSVCPHYQPTNSDSHIYILCTVALL